jgi:hypothetical protein
MDMVETTITLQQQQSMLSKFKRICVFCGSSQGKKTSYQVAAIDLGNELVLLLYYSPLPIDLHFLFVAYSRKSTRKFLKFLVPAFFFLYIFVTWLSTFYLC